MIEEKIPTWGMFKEYPEQLTCLLMILFCASNRNYQMRVWYRAEGPEVEWCAEWSFGFDDYMEDLDRRLKEGQQDGFLSKLQVERLYKLHHMVEEFYEKDAPPIRQIEGFREKQLCIINHPGWEKIRQYAKETLRLILDDYNPDGTKRPQPYF